MRPLATCRHAVQFRVLTAASTANTPTLARKASTIHYCAKNAACWAPSYSLLMRCLYHLWQPRIGNSHCGCSGCNLAAAHGPYRMQEFARCISCRNVSLRQIGHWWDQCDSNASACSVISPADLLFCTCCAMNTHDMTSVADARAQTLAS